VLALMSDGCLLCRADHSGSLTISGFLDLGLYFLVRSAHGGGGLLPLRCYVNTCQGLVTFFKIAVVVSQRRWLVCSWLPSLDLLRLDEFDYSIFSLAVG